MKTIVSFLISLIPINFFKIWLYRLLFNYNIDYKSKIGLFNIINSKNVKLINSSIGMFNLIKVETLTMNNSSINKMNRIKNLNVLELGERSRIYDKNFIAGGPENVDSEGFDFKQQNVIIGSDSAVNRNNYFDVVRTIKIGNNVVFGGLENEIWTHGFEVDRTMLVGDVIFGDDIFIGSRCTFTKGISIANNVTIGPASVIYKSIEEEGVYSTHQINKIK